MGASAAGTGSHPSREIFPAVLVESARTETWGALSGKLRALGFTVHWAGDADARPGNEAAVVRLVEQEHVAPSSATPFIIMASSGSPTGMADALNAGASGYFVLPIDAHSIGTAICVAWQRAREFEGLLQRTTKLSESLQHDQTVSTVVGMLMERYHCQRDEAYERLRRYARAERKKILEIATHILTASEEISRLLTAIDAAGRGK